MASSGDFYNYTVQVGVSGIRDLDHLESGIRDLRRALAETALAFQKGEIEAKDYRANMAALAADLKTLEGVQRQVNRATGGLGGGATRAAQNLTQLTFVIDDMQYGMRGLINQIPMISTALFGFGVAGAAAGAALTILAGLFRTQIDSALEWAGVLDENVVKGLHKGEEATDAYGAKVKALEGVLDDTTEAQREFAKALSGEGLGATQLDAALVQVVGQGSPLQAGLKEAHERVAAVEERLAGLIERGKGGADVFAQIAVEARKLDEAKEAVKTLGDDLAKLVGTSVEKMKAELEKGGEAAERVVERLEAVPNKGPDAVRAIEAIRDALEKAKAAAATHTAMDDVVADYKMMLGLEQQRTDELNEEWRERDAIRQEEHDAEIDRIKELHRIQVQAEEDRKARRLRELQQRNLEALDAETRRAVETFGPQMQGMIGQSMQRAVMMGASPEQARRIAFRGAAGFLERFGIGRDVAAGAAGQLVGEQFGPLRGAVDANNAAAEFARMQLQNSGIMLNAFDQARADWIQMMRETARQRGRLERHHRRFAPLQFMGGNPLGGWF